MKKFFALMLSLMMILGAVSFSASAETVPADQMKIGYIVIGDENEGYSANHLNALNKAIANLGISSEQVLIKYNIPETEEAYDAAIDLVDQGCNIIFATSLFHESYIIQAAIENPDVQFCHATGTNASLVNLPNFHNYFTAIYEGRYATGIVAGMKLNEMINNGTITAEQAKMGYVGAFPYAEVISGFTAFYLGAKSVCPSVTMEVKYTNSWGDNDLEATAASALIDDGCVLLSQHADTTGAPSTCEQRGVYCVGYNIDMTSVAPNTALISSACNWSAYVQYALECVINGTEISSDWSGGFSTEAVFVTDLNEKIAAEGTQAALDATIQQFHEGTIKVFDTQTFTVPAAEDGSYTVDEAGHLTAAFAIDSDGDWVNDSVEAVIDGEYKESFVRSAPYFALIIDGIEVK